jgi:methyl-accepting chemotaxis protein
MVVVPVIGLVLLAGIDLSRRLAVSGEMTELDRLTRLAMAAHDVAGALQDERSLTAGALTATGSVSEELKLQYQQTDQLVVALTDQTAWIEVEELDGQLQAVTEALEGLQDHRQQSAAGELPMVAAVSFYNQLTALLLPILNEVSQRSTDVEVKSQLEALGLLAHLKESADLERGALNVAFTAGEISPQLHRAVVGMIERQETLEMLFLDQAPIEIARAWQEQLDEEALEEILSLRLEALDGLDVAELGVNPRHWWQVSTARVDVISELKRSLGEVVVDKVETLRGQARRTALLGVLLVVLAVGGVAVLSAVVGRGINRSLSEASFTIREAVGQITSSVQQLSSSTGETAAAVSQTTTTVDELRQTSEAAADRAKSTSEAAELSIGASENAQKVAIRGIDAMTSIRSEVEGIAERIVELSKSNARISNIVENVDAIAQQSNLLAVNASIEAAKAEEHGRGFAVVANEVRTLAERSREATDQIRSILTEIQGSSNTAVMVTEQGVKRVDEGSSVIEELGTGVTTLADTIRSSSDASSQISLISGQQLTGIRQITEALRSVEQAASDNAAGAQQLEQAAHQLSAVSERIAGIVQGSSGVSYGR